MREESCNPKNNPEIEKIFDQQIELEDSCLNQKGIQDVALTKLYENFVQWIKNETELKKKNKMEKKTELISQDTKFPLCHVETMLLSVF